jgi:poly(hydroxyalkanoate) depolymerase family esterase
MKGLKDTLANLARLRRRFERLLSSAAKRGEGAPAASPRHCETTAFGSNPGNLRMFSHVPKGLSKAPALVVALHGCTQTAAVYDHGSGWSDMADSHGFAVLFPEQQRLNNPNNCFNWFLPSDTRRDRGEAHSIRQMIERMIIDNGIDRRRVFVVGLSAGGAMASAMLAVYPDVFAGGATIAGLPFASATNVQEAFEVMAKGRERAGPQWGDRVRSASTHRGSWPKLSVWHGTADGIVNARNMEDILKQWADVHDVSLRPSLEHKIGGHTRRVWRTDADVDVMEAISLTGMGHGVPLATGDGPGRCGNTSAFHFDVGISSSHHIARFWGLAERQPVVDDRVAVRRLALPVPAVRTSEIQTLAAREASAGNSVDGDRTRAFAFRDPREVITAALKAAGLLSEPGSAGYPPGGSGFDPRPLITSTLRSVRLLKE